jgi:hypothetical protein
MKTKIYGASDDIIEIEGEVDDEIDCYNATNKQIKCSDGTEARIKYDGNWNIIVKKRGKLFDKLVLPYPDEKPHTDDDCIGCTSYSDVLVLKKGIK